MRDPYDIVVLGSGPAALVFADACGALGASVAVVAPRPEASWLPNYCLWAEELPTAFEDAIEWSWDGVSVHTDLGDHHLDRRYVKLSTPSLQATLWARLRRHGVDVVDGSASELVPASGEVAVMTSDAARLGARVVVDATGAKSPFVRRIHQRAPAFQTAFGLLLDAPSHPFDPARAVLMDFRAADPGSPEPTSFLYVLPLGDGRLFIEETSLARRPSVDMALLRARLERRLRSFGLSESTRLGEEHCHIAMGLGLPERDQLVLPFGAAASMVHPASGYLQARVFRKAPQVAAALVAGLGEGDGRHATRRAMKILWPSSERALWETYGVGLEALVRMNATQTGRFFDAFFSLPTASWAGYLGGALTMPALRAAMADLFRLLPAGLRWSLFRSSVTGGAAPLARSFLPAGRA